MRTFTTLNIYTHSGANDRETRPDDQSGRSCIPLTQADPVDAQLVVWTTVPPLLLAASRDAQAAYLKRDGTLADQRILKRSMPS